MTTIIEFKCPYCSHSLSSEEYESALHLFKQHAQMEFDEKLEEERIKFQEELRTQHLNHRKEMESFQSKLTTELNGLYKDQIELMKKEYDILLSKKDNELNVLVSKRTSELEAELYYKERNCIDLQQKLQIVKVEALEEAKVMVQFELDEKKDKILQKEIQIRRVQEEVDKLRRQLSETQSELKGEVGEVDLYDKLNGAFHGDIIERANRGIESADIIHKIKLQSGTVLDTKIVYDNKNTNTVTQKDIEKAKQYMQIHKTEHVVIVSRNLPKRNIKNGLYGEINGVLVVHPSIIVEVAYQIRKAIVKISKLTMSCNIENDKKSKLYDFIRSAEFTNMIDSILKINEARMQIQNDEEKQHNTLWKKRKKLDEQERILYYQISTGIDTIIEDVLSYEKEDQNIDQN